MAGERVLVLGATGRIGAVLRAVWPDMYSDINAVWQSRQPQSAPGWVTFDPLTQPRDLAAVAAGCSAILCLSGVTNARAATGGVMGDNITLARAAIRAAGAGQGAGQGAGARVLLASSAAVYGNQAGVLGETAPLRAQSDYGRAKVGMEADGARLGAELGVGVCALRIGNIAGLDAILGGWRPGFRLDRFGDGRTPRRSYIGMITLARVLGALIRRPDLPAALNIAAPGPVQMGALLDAAGLGWTAQVPQDTAIADVALDVGRLAAMLGPLAQADPDEMVAEWREMTQK